MGKIKDAVKTVRLETAPSASTVSSTSWKIPVEVKVFDPPVNGRAVLVKYIQPAFVHAGDPSKNRPAETRFAFFASKAQADRAILKRMARRCWSSTRTT